MEFEKLILSPIFKGLTTNELKDLLENNHYQIQNFDKGEIVALQDEPCNRLIILIEGYVKAEMADASAKVVKVEDVHAPNPLAILFLFGKDNRFPVQVTAQERVSALVIPKSSVLNVLQQSQTVLHNYLNISAMYASMLSKKLHLMSFRTIRQKLAMYFLDLTKPNLTKAELDRTQLALSEYFGVSRPALARELGNMQNDGLIEVNKRQVKILDRNRLVQIISF